MDKKFRRTSLFCLECKQIFSKSLVFVGYNVIKVAFVRESVWKSTAEF